MKLPFVKCMGMMCDPHVQDIVYRAMLEVDPKQWTDYWTSVETPDYVLEVNVFDDEYGAATGYLTAVCYPVYKAGDGVMQVDFSNTLGRAAIKESDINNYWITGEKAV